VTCSRELACEVVRRLDSAPGHRPDTDKLAPSIDGLSTADRRPVDSLSTFDRQPETIEAQLALGFASFPPLLRE
jgi:hypothetical protein